jgi:large subunit ribosomal protein L4
MEGKELGKVAASEDIFGREVNIPILHEALTWYLATTRRGTASAKTRAEVRGGGIKPWKQKGTGRARAGSIRSPLWRKGGVVFGPKPRGYAYALPKKVRKLALKIALSDKAKSGKIKVLDELKVEQGKTKEMAIVLNKLKLEDEKSLFVIPKEEEKLKRATRNLKRAQLTQGKDLNIFDILNAKWVVLTKEAVDSLKEVLG